MVKYGECVVRRLPDGGLKVEKADELILVSRELLAAAMSGDLPYEHQVAGIRLVGDGDLEIAGVVYRLEGPARDEFSGPDCVAARRVSEWS